MFPRRNRSKSSWAAATAHFWSIMPDCIRNAISWAWNGCWAGCANWTARGGAPGWTICAGCASSPPIFWNTCCRAASVTALHIYFPDPWPKRKHRKNRLVNARFTEIARQALAPGGEVYLRTDDEDYFAQMVTVFAANSSFRLIETPAELSAVVTDFERGFTRAAWRPGARRTRSRADPPQISDQTSITGPSSSLRLDGGPPRRMMTRALPLPPGHSGSS